MAMQRWFPRRTLVAWRPLRELEEMEQRLEDMFVQAGEWVPSVDMFEKGDRFVIKAELPGIKQEDIDVSVTDSTLMIRGEKKTGEEVREQDYQRSECSYGSFCRSITLPSNIDTGKIEATYDNGVLEMSIPKTAEARPKKIPVTAAARAEKSEKPGRRRSRKETEQAKSGS
jgi:HSP20 family protein